MLLDLHAYGHFKVAVDYSLASKTSVFFLHESCLCQWSKLFRKSHPLKRLLTRRFRQRMSPGPGPSLFKDASARKFGIHLAVLGKIKHSAIFAVKHYVILAERQPRGNM